MSLDPFSKIVRIILPTCTFTPENPGKSKDYHFDDLSRKWYWFLLRMFNEQIQGTAMDLQSWTSRVLMTGYSITGDSALPCWSIWEIYHQLNVWFSLSKFPKLLRSVVEIHEPVVATRPYWPVRSLPRKRSSHPLESLAETVGYLAWRVGPRIHIQILNILLMQEILHQLRLVVYPIIVKVLAPSQVVIAGFPNHQHYGSVIGCCVV